MTDSKDTGSESTGLLRWVKRRWLLVVLAALAVGTIGYFVWPSVAGIQVSIVGAERRELVQTVVTTGRVRPQNIRISSLASGEVVEVGAREGASVAKGTLLARLDDREARATLTQARAKLAEAKALKRRVSIIGIKDANEQLVQAKVRLQDAERKLKRIEKLLSSNAVTQAQYESAQTAAQLASSALRAAQAQRNDVGSGGARQSSANAVREQAAAAVALAELRLEQTRIEAAVDAVVLSRNVEVGDVVQLGASLFELSGHNTTELVAQPDERNLALLKLGQPAIGSAAAFPEMTFAATLSYMAPSVDSRRGTIEIRLAVAEAPDYLRPDMTVSIDIEVARRADALTLPIEAVRDLAKKPWVLEAVNRRAVRRDIRTGAIGDRNVEVTSGLEEGAQIILDPAVSPGNKVRVKTGKGR